MAVPSRELHLLFMRSGNRCAFTDCRRLLTAEGNKLDRIVVLGEAAHMVAESPKGPRGDSPLTLEERNRYDNLMLLCSQHHQLVDAQPKTYTVERLRGMKGFHELRVQNSQGPWDEETASASEITSFVEEPIYSTLLPVEHLPPFVYGAPVGDRLDSSVFETMGPLRGGEMAPSIVREGMIYAFQDMSVHGNPFGDLVSGQPVEQFRTRDWVENPDTFRWFIDLANRSLNKLTGRHGLHLDRRHRRYFFPIVEIGNDRSVSYKPLNRKRTARKVVWQPKSKRTGEGRGYWYHRGVSLRFLQLSAAEWCLSVRPELHVTTDGQKPLRSDKVGARVTQKKSRMFNYDLLGEVHFWRDFLSESRPRIILPFGDAGQYFMISTTLMGGSVSWPGIPEEHAKPFKNVQYVDDLFSWAELQQLEAQNGDGRWSDDVEGDEDVDLDS